MQRQALMEVFRNLRPDSPEGHETTHVGLGGECMEETRPYRFGDPVSHLDLTATLRNAVRRGGPGLPIRLQESDFEVQQTESKATCSTVILLDMSGSMNRWNRFTQAKRLRDQRLQTFDSALLVTRAIDLFYFQGNTR